MGERVAVAERIDGLAARLGVGAFVAECTALMAGADRDDHVEALLGLTNLDAVPSRDSWHDYWLRTWGARGLLHVWHDSATPPIVTGLDDEHWRPAEMCLKVAATHDVAGTADGAARLAVHEMARVRAQAVRALGVVGDTEHVDVVRGALDDPDAAVVKQAVAAMARLERRLDLG